MRIKKMKTKGEILAEQQKQRIIADKREKLFRSLATIHSLSKVIQIAYFDAIKGTNFNNPKIKYKSDQIHKFSEDILNSLGDAVRLKEDHADFMEYEHFAEVYECLKVLIFIDTQSIRNITSMINGELKKITEQECQEIIKQSQK